VIRTIVLQGLFCSLVFLFFVNGSQAVIETYQFSNSELELRYKQLSAELRCPKCQNQNIADSNAPIAQDLRKLLVKQLEEGASDEQILEYMVSRYGEFVRYRPRFSGATLALWLMPVALIVGAILVFLIVIRGGRNRNRDINAQEQQQLNEILQRESDS